MPKLTPSVPVAGKKAPAFSLESSDGQKVSLASLKGRKAVLYFYPKDDTPGCTTEAQEFRDLMGEFKKLGVAVYGVSPDTVKSHCKFIGKQDLTFPLLADIDHKVADKFGLWVEKSMYGKKYWGVQRATFFFDENGKIAQAWPKVNPKDHAQEVLDAAKAMK